MQFFDVNLKKSRQYIIIFSIISSGIYLNIDGEIPLSIVVRMLVL